MTGQICPFETGMSKGNFMTRLEYGGPKDRHLLPLTDGISRHKSGGAKRVHPVVSGLHKPTRNIVERFPAVYAMRENSFKV